MTDRNNNNNRPSLTQRGTLQTNPKLALTTPRFSKDISSPLDCTLNPNPLLRPICLLIFSNSSIVASQHILFINLDYKTTDSHVLLCSLNQLNLFTKEEVLAFISLSALAYTINCVSMFRKRKTISVSIRFDIFYTLIAVLLSLCLMIYSLSFRRLFDSIVRIVYKSIRPET